MDFVDYLPKELSDEIFTYLPAKTLGIVALCCQKWRERSQQDLFWIHHCMVKGWMKYGLRSNILAEEHMQPTNKTNVSGNSPVFIEEVPKDSSLEPMPKWKSVYVRVLHLNNNWTYGKYIVAPLLRGHKDRVTAMDCDGKLLATGSDDSSFIVWEVISGQIRHRLNYHSDAVNVIKMKGHKIATGCADGVIRVIDLYSGKLMVSFTGHCSVDHLHFDGESIVSVSADRAIRLWSLQNKKLITTLRGHIDEIECLAVYGTLAVTGSWDCTLMLWDLETHDHRLTLEGHKEVVNCCQLDDRQILSGSADSTLILWSTESGNIITRFYGHTEEVYCCAYNKEVLLSGSSDSTVRVWGYDGQCKFVLHEHIGVVRCLHLDLISSGRFVTGGDQKKVVVWDYKEGKCLNVVHRHPTRLHLMWVNESKLITASPEKAGTVTVISYW